MGLTLPDRTGREGGEPPRFRLPVAASAAVSVEIDLGTGRSWPARITDFSADGLRLVAPVAFTPGTPAVLTLRDFEGAVPPAVFAVEIRWARTAPRGRSALGARVIAAVDGHHAAFLGRVLERLAAKSDSGRGDQIRPAPAAPGRPTDRDR